MKYKKVTQYSFWWVYWLYAFYFLILFLSFSLYLVSDSSNIFLCSVAIIFIGIFYVVIVRKKVRDAKKISNDIHEHIVENGLCEMEVIDNRIVYDYYPKVWWNVDEKQNLLYIRFRLTGNKINLRGLEKGLSDRLKKICLNVYEERGFIEYIFELEAEQQLVIASPEGIKEKFGDTQISLSSSFTWDYERVPHFLIAGSTGVGKSTLSKFLISALTNCGVRVVYIDIKRDYDMELYCNGNSMVTYACKEDDIVRLVKEIAKELQLRTKDIEKMGLQEEFDFGFNPIFLVCDEIILLKLQLPKKIYDEIIASINSIIVAGRSKNLFCGLITQSALAEYFGNSGIRNNIGLKIALGQMTPTELSMIFGNEFSDVKNLRYNVIGSGLIMRSGIDSRPREFIAPYIEKGALDD